jgi:hypothetical protein
MTLIECIALVLLSCMTYVTAPEPIKNGLIAQIEPAPLAINIVTQYATWATGTIAHEAGHAYAAKLLGSTKQQIHLGATFTSNQNHKPIAQLGMFCLDGFNQFLGSTEHGLTDKEQQKIMLLAGGLSGAFAHWIIQIAKDHTTQQISPGIIYQIMLTLWPVSQGSDGYRLWEDHWHMPKEQITTAQKLAPFILIAPYVLCSLNDKKNSPDAPIHTKAMLGLINYLLCGYAEFHAIAKT